MIALLQRVTEASVKVDGHLVGQIGTGLLVLLGVEQSDQASHATRLAERTLAYRMFSDAEDKMNLSVCDMCGEILVVPQFTLAANTRKGNRPSFQNAAPPEVGLALFDRYCDHLKQSLKLIQKGQFAADMKVSLTNDGPVTFWLQV